MKEKIKSKIDERIEFILAKPVSKITPGDYTILADELRRIAAEESNAEFRKRMLDMASYGFGGVA